MFVEEQELFGIFLPLGGFEAVLDMVKPPPTKTQGIAWEIYI